MKASGYLVQKTQKGRRCILMFCLIKAPFMFSWNKALIKWIAHSLHWWAAKAQVLAAATPVRSQFRYDSLSTWEKTVSLGLFLNTQQPATWCAVVSTTLDVEFGAFCPSLVPWGHPCSRHPLFAVFEVSEEVSSAVGMRLYLIYHFSLHWLWHLLVKKRCHWTPTSLTVA